MELLENQEWDTAFQPYVETSPEADALTFYFRPDPDYSERLNDHVTLYRSLESRELVGCRIKGISGIIEDLPNFVNVDYQGIRLSLVFLAFRGGVGEDARNVFKQLAEAAGDRTLQTA